MTIVKTCLHDILIDVSLRLFVAIVHVYLLVHDCNVCKEAVRVSESIHKLNTSFPNKRGLVV